LIPLGALVGLGVGALLSRRPAGALQPERRAAQAAAHAAPGALPEGPGWLLHPNLLARFGRLVALAAGLFLLAWLAGYFLLPEGALRGGGSASLALTGSDGLEMSFLAAFWSIFRHNLFSAALLLAGSMVMRVQGVSFGAFAALFNVTLYGLVLGSNSFSVPMAERMAPSLAVFARSGPYEMLALLLLGAAATFWPVYQVRWLFRTAPERIQMRPRPTRAELLAVLVALLVLAAANAVEAAQMVNRLTGG
jgi:hypothetical protein